MASDPVCLWIFAYGSLMWRPDFEFAERQRAALSCYHRALCIRSHHYRGTPERPGLVFGLDRGGACTGVAFRIESGQWASVLDRVRRREMITGVYREIETPVTLADGRTVRAVAYIADPDHDQYAGRLPLDVILRIVRESTGESGANLDYVRNTQAHLLDLGVDDPDLTTLCAALNGVLDGCAPDKKDDPR